MGQTVEPWLTKREAAERARCSVSTVGRAIREGRLRAGGRPGLVRIRAAWVDAWIEARPLSASRGRGPASGGPPAANRSGPGPQEPR